MDEQQQTADERKSQWRKDASSFLPAIFKQWGLWICLVLGCPPVLLYRAGGHVIPAWILWVIVLFGVPLAAFRVYRGQLRIAEAKERENVQLRSQLEREKLDRTVELEKPKADQIHFAVEFIDYERRDPQLYSWALRVRITHQHLTKTAKEVRVALKEIQCEGWRTKGRPRELDQVNFPQLLPEKGSGDASQKHEIASPPAGKEFDVLLVKNNLAISRICLAPYETPAYVNFWEEWPPPPPRGHRLPTSKAAEFDAMDSGAQREQVIITIQVTGEDAATVEKKSRLCITRYSLKMPDPPPPHWEAI
jgi:hypothetical protein